MPLGYRSIFTIFGEQSKTEEMIMEQFNEWLKRDPVRHPRNLNRDLYELDSVTVFDSGSELIYFKTTTLDGTRTVRARLIEKKFGRWREVDFNHNSKFPQTQTERDTRTLRG